MSFLHGHTVNMKKDAKCSKHPEMFAVKSVISEADSLGYETTEMCQQCYDEYVAAKKKKRAEPAHCDHCGGLKILAKTRDPEEGSMGPVYDLCRDCRVAMQNAWRK